MVTAEGVQTITLMVGKSITFFGDRVMKISVLAEAVFRFFGLDYDYDAAMAEFYEADDGAYELYRG